MMGTGYQSAHAAGTKGECREGRVRHTVTMDKALFDDIRASAMKKNRSISEEIAGRLAASRGDAIANPGP
jgi:hypothetical protein